jgi:hypothetical protein
MAQIFKGRVYSNSPYPSAEVNYEYTRDGANMKYKFTGKVYLESSGGWYYNNLRLKLYLNGADVYTKDCKSSSKGWSISFDSGWLTVKNKTSGTTPFYFTVKDTQNTSWCNYKSSTYNLTVAPAYTSITKFNVNKRDETSVTFDYTTANTCDKAWYSKDDGANWTELSSDNIISGLSANTTYKFKLRVRRKDSQLTTDSSAVSQTTYDYPHITAVKVVNLTIGSTQTLTIYNPLSREITVKMYQNSTSGTVLHSTTTSTTSIDITPVTSTLYASIPNSQSGKAVYSVVYGSTSTRNTSGDYYYSVKGTEVPTFSSFTYKDTNTTVTNVTGNDQVLVKGLSSLEVTIASTDKMVAVNSASPNNYVITIDTLSTTVDYSNDNVVTSVGTITSSGTKRLNVTAYDSRSLSKLVYKDITVYDYNKPVINSSVARLNNFESQTTLKVSGTFTKLNINSVDKNSIQKVQYRYRETGGTWSNWTTLNTTVSSGKFTCNDVILSLDNSKSFEFEIQAEDKLQSNTTTCSVAVGQAIFFVSSNKRACYINSKQVMTGRAEDVNNSDLNTYTSEFVAGYGYSLKNTPTGDSYGHLVSIPRHDADGYTTQLFSPYTTNDLYIRKCEANQWGDWVKVSTGIQNDDINNNTLIGQTESNQQYIETQGETGLKYRLMSYDIPTKVGFERQVNDGNGWWTVGSVDSLGLNKRVQLGVNESEVMYLRGVLEDGTVYQTRETLHKIEYQKAINDNWSTIWSVNGHVGEFIHATLSADYTLTSASYTTIPFKNNRFSSGTSLTLQTDGGIKIGAGITAIRVHGQVYYYTGTAGQKGLQILRNTEVLCRSLSQNVANYTVLQIDNVFPVSEGQVIYIQMLGANKDLLKNYAHSTNFVVEVIR